MTKNFFAVRLKWEEKNKEFKRNLKKIQLENSTKSVIRALKVNKFGRITSVVDNLFFLRNSLVYGRQIYFYRLKLGTFFYY